MSSYVEWVTQNPILSAAIQFGILGTLGEAVSVSLRRKKLSIPGAAWQVCAKILAWALLG
jgi:hypothetical protein